ncbi:MAG: hypothetical protein BGO70_08280 [Bacteroidetes bacterium 43-93]|jgi:hypothetical protein|nr:DUF4783 domain-containing protein [Bacteroidota bacterium]OJW97763.1 MAG: hypothetical protein BGO70_08280 [Bacteroidetes bacterium 43-93]
MNKLYKRFFLSILLCFSLLAANAQALEDVTNGIRNGNVTMITKYLDNTVAITMSNNQSIYSKAQAEIVLRDFFTKNPVKQFTVRQGGPSGTSAKYAVGALETSNGTFQVYLVMNLKDDNFLLREIRFEK